MFFMTNTVTTRSKAANRKAAHADYKCPCRYNCACYIILLKPKLWENVTQQRQLTFSDINNSVATKKSQYKQSFFQNLSNSF